LETTFDETVYGDGFIYVVGREGLLEDFEVLDVLVLVFGIELRLSGRETRGTTLTLLSGTSTKKIISV
jgi:hypothetical protein